MTRSRPHATRSVIFTPALQVHRYPPAAWGGGSDDEGVDDDDEWDMGSYKDEDPPFAEEAALAEQEPRGGGDSDDGMSWEEALSDPSRAHGPTEEQRRQQDFLAQQLQQKLWQQQEAEQQALQHYRQQRIEGQRRPQQIMAQTTARQASATSTQGPGRLSIRHQGSREQLILPQESSSVSPSSSSASARFMDLINASETKKMSLTPLLVQDNNQRSRPPRQAPPRPADPMLPSGVMQRQEEERKRTHEGIGALEEAARTMVKQTSSGRPQGRANLRKEPRSSDDDSSTEKDKKSKSGGLFGRRFDRRKDKHKKTGTSDSIDISWPIEARSSEEPG